MNDVTKTNKHNKSTVTPETTAPTPAARGLFGNIGYGFKTAFNYGYAGLKVVDIVARIVTAGALYLKLDETLLNWGAAFLAATAVWEIGVALIKAHGPNRSK
jgi:hypothetical protein